MSAGGERCGCRQPGVGQATQAGGKERAGIQEKETQHGHGSHTTQMDQEFRIFLAEELSKVSHFLLTNLSF